MGLLLCCLLLAGLLLAGFAATNIGASATALPVRSSDTDVLRVATYNVHYIWLARESGAWSVGDWERRKAPLDAAFKALNADLVAFQEMESFAHGAGKGTNLTLEWLLKNNPAWAATAVGDWRTYPSTQPILYRRDRLNPLEQGWYFFSNTPDVIYSRTFNGSFPAFASWVRFEERASGDTFTVVNIHFEFKSFSNRRLSAELVATRTAPLIESGERVMLLGDVNAFHGMTPMKILEGAGLSFMPVRGSTYHLNRGINLLGAIDHIGYSDGLEAVTDPVVLRRRFLAEWPSDHYPVVGELRLRK